MSIVRIAAGFVLALGLCAPAMAAPLEAYGKLPSIESVALSPSGHATAIVITNGEERMIVVRDNATGKVIQRAATGSVKVRDVSWADDKRLLLVTSVTHAPADLRNARREWTMAFSLDIDTRKVKPLLSDVEGGMNTIFDAPVIRTYKGERAVFVQGVKFSGGQGLLSLFRVDLDTGRSRLVELGTNDTQDWVVGPTGEAMAQEQYDRHSGRWTLKVRTKAGGWRDAATAVAKVDRPYVLGLGRDGATILYTPNGAGGVFGWREASLEGGATSAGEIETVDDQTPLRDPQDGRLIGYRALVGDESRYTFFAPQDAKVWKAVAAAYPGQAVNLVSWSGDRKKIVVHVDSPTEGPAFALVDLGTKSSSWIGPEYLGVQPADIGPVRPLKFNAKDGLALTGYLTLPHGKAPKGLPAIIFPHGGPAARDTPGFNWWAQGMASRGYAVVQVNFRGSDGLGDKLLAAGYGEWGRKMQTDLSDAVRHLAAEGLIDPKRVCIVGSSYGGYAALAGATIDRGVYRCAVSVAGVSHLSRQVAYSRTRGGLPSERYWHRFMGAEGRRDEVLDEYSPAAQAAKADIPILLIHGRDDTVVPLDQTRIMADALGKAGKPYEMIVQKGADHWLSRGDTRLQTLTATMAFVEKHNPPN